MKKLIAVLGLLAVTVGVEAFPNIIYRWVYDPASDGCFCGNATYYPTGGGHSWTFNDTWTEIVTNPNDEMEINSCCCPEDKPAFVGTVKKQQSVNGGPWTDVAGTTSSLYIPTGVSTEIFRCGTTNGMATAVNLGSCE